MTSCKPPRWADWLLRKYCNPGLLEAVEGDLYEVFMEDVEARGLKAARRRYLLNAIAFLRHSRLRKKNYSKTQNHMDLFSNYLKVSFRDIRRHRLFSAINLFGLISGFTALLLILQFALFESQYDRFHQGFENLYRVVNQRYQNGTMVQEGAITYPVVGPALARDYAEVEAYTRLTVGGRNYLNHRGELFMMEDYIWADEHFLDFFSFPIVAGDKDALDASARLVLTESFARRFLQEGEEVSSLIGQTIHVNDWDFPCTITAILKDIPADSHLQFDVAISYKTFIRLAGDGADNSLEWSDFYHYVRLTGDTDEKEFQPRLEEFSERYFKNGEVSGAVEQFYLQPLDQVHLDNSLEYEYASVTDGAFVWLIVVIAIIIVLIAWINYVNLTTSRAIQRAREVGIRKVMGAYRGQLIGQFLTESFLLNFLALLISCVVILAIQPWFNSLTKLPLNLAVLLQASVAGIPFPVIFLSGFVVMVLLIGLYPAFLLSGFKTEEVLKGKYGLAGDMVSIRKILVIIQFAAALVLISGSVAVYRQIDFMRSQDLGMDMDHTLVVYGPDLTGFDSTYIPGFNRFKEELITHPGIRSVTASARMFGDRLPRAFRIHSPADAEKKDLTCSWMAVDQDFIELFDLQLLAGRSLDRSDYHTNGDLVHTAVLNESALQLFGFKVPREAIGQKIEIQGRYQPEFEIVGVVENFHQSSLDHAIEPILLLPFHDNGHFISVKYEAGMEERAIATVKELFGTFYPGNYFDYYFLSDHFDRQYQDDERIGTISSLFTVLAIILAVLGLYGLVLITFMKRTREIGIRKVLGADLFVLLGLFGKQFLILTGIAVLVGLPVSYLVIRRFLQDYAYSTGVEVWVLVTSAASLLTLCMLTILLQTRRISANNPAESLRCE